VSFLVAWRLWLLLGVGALTGGWVAASQRRRRDAVRFTNVALMDVVIPRRPAWRRHVPAVLFLVALTALILGFARPVRAVRVADERSIIMLAIDTSRSMEADDVAPTRLAVAQEAALDFVDQLPDGIDVGLVSFNGVATVAVTPSEDREAVRAAIEGLELGDSTAIGEAIFASLGTIEDLLASEGAGPDDEGADGEGPDGEDQGDDGDSPGRIVLMSDGETTVGRPNQEAASAAADAGVPVYTIAFGTPDGTVVAPDGVDQPVPVAPEPLREIADGTGGQAFEAASLSRLAEVYRDIGGVVGFRTEDRDISGWFVGAGLALLAAASSFSLLWSQRLP
jgi:Ca-activated chloride channel family protein